MKKIILGLICIVCVAGTSFAQGLNSEEQNEWNQLNVKERAEWVADKMVEKYDISTEQKHQVKMAAIRRSQAIDKAAPLYSSDQAAFGVERTAIRTAYHNELKTILTQSQYDAYMNDYNSASMNNEKEKSLGRETAPQKQDNSPWGDF